MATANTAAGTPDGTVSHDHDGGGDNDYDDADVGVGMSS